MLSRRLEEYHLYIGWWRKKVEGTALLVARIIRFYGFSLLEVKLMDTLTLSEFVGAMEKIEAQEQLKQIEASSFINLNSDDRKKIYRSYASKLDIKRETMSVDDAARWLTNGK